MPDIINIGDTDENADWIKSLPGHASEIQLHDVLAAQYAEEADGDVSEKPPLSTEETMQATVEWWRENMPPRYAGLLDATLREKEANNG